MVYVIIEGGMPLGNFAKIYYVRKKFLKAASGNFKMASASRGLAKQCCGQGNVAFDFGNRNHEIYEYNCYCVLDVIL